MIPIPSERLKVEDFVSALRRAPDHLVYFLLNVGDADTQLILLPCDIQGANKGTRRLIVIDVATNDKLPSLIESLAEANVLSQRSDLVPIVIGTHPHDDHISGIPQLLDWLGDHISEYWDPGYYHPTGSYVETMRALEDRPLIQYTQPTSGMTRFINRVKLVVITPGIGLRSRFDSYGTTINDSSIALRIEFPVARIVQMGENRHYTRLRKTWSLILGADAQTTSWAQATIDFPELHRRDNSALYTQLRMALGADALKTDIFKVPHHGSKHGLNLELVERMSPRLCLISSTVGGGRFHFPHDLALGAIREALRPSTSKRGRPRTDHDLGIHCTGDSDDSGAPLGTIALMLPPRKGSRLRLWRFGDETDEKVELKNARSFRFAATKSGVTEQ